MSRAGERFPAVHLYHFDFRSNRTVLVGVSAFVDGLRVTLVVSTGHYRIGLVPAFLQELRSRRGTGDPIERVTVKFDRFTVDDLQVEVVEWPADYGADGILGMSWLTRIPSLTRGRKERVGRRARLRRGACRLMAIQPCVLEDGCVAA